MADNLIRIKNSKSVSKLFSTKRSPALELKASAFTLPVVRLGSCDLAILAHELTAHLAQSINFLRNSPVVLDLEPVRGEPTGPDFPKLIQLLRQSRLIPVAVRHGNQMQHEAAILAGLAVLKGGREVKDAVTSQPSGSGAETAPAAAHCAPGNQVVIVDSPVRSGQRIHAPDADLIVLASVNYGAEVIADGNIHIYGTLRGRALAGAAGNVSARIFVQAMAGELVSIAGHHQIFEEPQPKKISAKPVQFFLNGDTLQMSTLG